MEPEYVGIDLHRRRSVIVRMSPDGEQLSTVKIANDAMTLAAADGGPEPEGGGRGHLRLVLGGRRPGRVRG